MLLLYFFFALVRVDDYNVAYSNKLYVDAWLAHFCSGFDTYNYMDIKLIKNVTHLLQMRITRSHTRICLDKERKIGVLAAKHGVHECKHVLTPISSHLDLAISAHTYVALIPCKHLVGALLWIDRHAHPEVMHATV